MPTYEADRRFLNEFGRLSTEQQEQFRDAVAKLVADLRAGVLRKGLRVKRVQGRFGIWEMTWAGDGRATFTYGEPRRPGQPHIVWRRIGSHDIFEDP